MTQVDNATEILEIIHLVVDSILDAAVQIDGQY